MVSNLLVDWLVVCPLQYFSSSVALITSGVNPSSSKVGPSSDSDESAASSSSDHHSRSDGNSGPHNDSWSGNHGGSDYDWSVDTDGAISVNSRGESSVGADPDSGSVVRANAVGSHVAES